MLNSGCSCLHPATNLPPWLINHWDIHGYPMISPWHFTFFKLRHTFTRPAAHAPMVATNWEVKFSTSLICCSRTSWGTIATLSNQMEVVQSTSTCRYAKFLQLNVALKDLESLKRLEVLLQAKAQLCLMHDFSHVGSFVKQSQMFECLLTRSVCDEATGYYAFVGTKLGAQFIISGQCNELNVDPHHWMAPQL